MVLSYTRGFNFFQRLWRVASCATSCVVLRAGDRLSLAGARCLVLSGLLCYGWAHAQTNASASAQQIKNTVYVCNQNGVISLRNTQPVGHAEKQACQRKEVVTILPARRVVQALSSYNSYASYNNASASMVDPRTRLDPQATSQTLVLGARVPATVQVQRDMARRRIILTELQAAQQRLGQLQAEYQNGEPARQGNERNYQKYLDRVAMLKQQIQNTEASISSLQRELSNLSGGL